MRADEVRAALEPLAREIERVTGAEIEWHEDDPRVPFDGFTAQKGEAVWNFYWESDQECFMWSDGNSEGPLGIQFILAEEARVALVASTIGQALGQK